MLFRSTSKLMSSSSHINHTTKQSVLALHRIMLLSMLPNLLGDVKAIFPPFTYLLKLTCIYKTEKAAIHNTQILARKLRADYSNLYIFGPTPAFYERQRDTHRWQIVVKSPTRTTLLNIIAQLPSTHWQYDIDPINLL